MLMDATVSGAEVSAAACMVILKRWGGGAVRAVGSFTFTWPGETLPLCRCCNEFAFPSSSFALSSQELRFITCTEPSSDSEPLLICTGSEVTEVLMLLLLSTCCL